MKKSEFYYLFLVLVAGCATDNEGFSLIDPKHSGVVFDNRIEENDQLNVFNYMNLYTGAGVALGDLNNDGLSDIFFSGNMVSNALYLNKGNMEFQDISTEAGITDQRWCTGVTMVDINQDGLLDIYVSVAGGTLLGSSANLLYINNGLDETGELKFVEKAEKYGLADERQSMNAAFFDYDKDGDLDMYLLVNSAAYSQSVNSSKPRKLNGECECTDRLYRNDDGNYIDISDEAGILVEGYGLGVGISDINGDSWPDIYVSNDFIGNDIMYINQGDGTFKDEITKYLNHTSYAGMGNSISDIDNNGKPDIMVLDMRPEDNKRQKTIISSTGYDRFELMINAGYQHQYSRNTLQLNMGEGKFSEIGNLSGVSSTDWSWSSLIADFDNDGFKDVFVTNGFLRDLGDLDYIHYQKSSANPMGDQQTKIENKLNSIKALPEARLQNYFYQNDGNLRFVDRSDIWGTPDKSCSNGAAYGDIDNDGDLDIVVNNVNQTAFIYENKINKDGKSFIKLRLKGKKGNIRGIGAKIKLSTKSGSQFAENHLTQGYESSMDPNIHFGFEAGDQVQKLEIWWPNGDYQLIEDIQTGQTIEVIQKHSSSKKGLTIDRSEEKLFLDYTDSINYSYSHKEDIMVDFKLQPILPHMHSRGGPGISVSDINGDGLDDFFVGGAADSSGQLWIQNIGGHFTLSNWHPEDKYEDMGSLIFDANNDGLKDLYVVSGGVLTSEENIYQDRLYINNGKSGFEKSNALPQIEHSGSTVIAADYDKDGDLDLFVGGRVNPGKYPLSSKSYLLENEINGGANKLKYNDISDQIDGWDELTMVTSAIWTDYDNDGWQDLIVVGEFMSIKVFHNSNGKLEKAKNIQGLEYSDGWWNSISGADFDMDGDIDYIVGNLGHNHEYQVSQQEPLCIYAADYDKDGNIDPVMCYFNEGKNYIAHSRDELISQISVMRSRFKTYKSFSELTFEESFLPEELETAYVVKSHRFASSYLENLGDGRFNLRELPIEAQFGPLEGIVIEDLDNDGSLEVVLTGNSYSTEVATGRYDGFMGVTMELNDDNSFRVLDLNESGFINDFDASGMALIHNPTKGLHLVVANNNDKLRTFKVNPAYDNRNIFSIDSDVIYALVELKNGKSYRKEFYKGSGYLSQNSDYINVNDAVDKVFVTTYNGKTTKIYEHETIE